MRENTRGERCVIFRSVVVFFIAFGFFEGFLGKFFRVGFFLRYVGIEEYGFVLGFGIRAFREEFRI